MQTVVALDFVLSNCLLDFNGHKHNDIWPFKDVANHKVAVPTGSVWHPVNNLLYVNIQSMFCLIMWPFCATTGTSLDMNKLKIFAEQNNSSAFT